MSTAGHELAKHKTLILGGLSAGVIWIAAYYLWTPAYVATPPPEHANSSKTKAERQIRTDRMQWMGVMPASAPDEQEDSRPQAEVIAALIATRSPTDALKAYQIIEGCEMLRLMSERSPIPRILLSRHKRCASVTDVIRRSRYDYLRTAAYGGAPGAGSAWLHYGPSGDPEALRTTPNDPSVIEWKRQATALVVRDGDRGDLNAVQDLMNGYAGKTPIFDADPSRELAYSIAYKDIVDLLLSGMAVPNQPTDIELTALAAKLSPEQVAWAKAKARAIVAAHSKLAMSGNL
jgi:hypothetical protein